MLAYTYKEKNGETQTDHFAGSVASLGEMYYDDGINVVDWYMYVYLPT